MPNRPKLTVVIPCYNGSQLLQKNLPKLQLFLKKEGIAANIIVVDDHSTDDSVALLERQWAGVTLIKRSQNGGFGQAVNTGMRQVKTPYVLLLNTDVVAVRGLLGALNLLLHNPKWWAISALQQLDEHKLGGAARPEWRHGLLRHRDYAQQATKPMPILYPSGGAALVRTKVFLDLGGFAPQFSPFYWEDADLGWRAWQKGWETMFDPEFVVRHQDSATISTQIPPLKVRTIAARNLLVFNWRALWGKVWLMHLVWLPIHLVRALLTFDGAWLGGSARALVMAITGRLRAPQHPTQPFWDFYQEAGGKR